MKENTRGASLNRELTAFGPVPSVRLGRSLGINNIPSNMCFSSCIFLHDEQQSVTFFYPYPKWCVGKRENYLDK